MNNQTVISAENVGKAYRINHQVERQRYASLRDVVANKFKRILRTGHQYPNKSESQEDFWALRNVDFDLKQGDVLGIIGRNGAGKSTMLKILGRITEPSEGRVRIKGRIASLLEVGTGFHPELTGRENIFLNGAILGMRRAEIKSKFDEIVAFAEVEKFLDTAVKFYSSGMYVRLAFAVAAHLEPEILIVDEVLAVGDAEFQKKCLGKMQDVSNKEGRTVLFVSHHIASVQRLCTRGLLLQNGNVEALGQINQVVDRYLAESQANSDGRRQIQLKEGECRIRSWSIVGENGCGIQRVLSRQSAQFSVVIESKRQISFASLGFVIRTLTGDLLLSANSRDEFTKPFDIPLGLTKVAVTVRLPLRMGQYRVELTVADENWKIVDHWIAEPLLSVLQLGNSVLPPEWHGLINEPVHFEVVS